MTPTQPSPQLAVPAATQTRHDARLVFVGGVASGGTDLMQSVLNGHGEIFLPGEFPFLAALADRFGPSVAAAELDDLVAEMRRLDEYRTFRNHHWTNFVADRKDDVELPPPPPPDGGRHTVADVYQWLLGVPAHVRVSGNKTPTNTENMDRLHRVFPAAKFILIVRDPRDVAISWRRKWGKDELLAAAKWEHRLALGRRHIAGLPAGTVHILRFEDLLDDLEGESRRVCRFLGLDFDPEMLRFHEHVTKFIHGKPNWGQPIIPGNYGKWRDRLSGSEVRRIEEVAFDGMAVHGYAPAKAARRRPLRTYELVRGRGRDVYATLFVGNREHKQGRLRNHLETIVFELRKYFLRRTVRR